MHLSYIFLALTHRYNAYSVEMIKVEHTLNCEQRDSPILNVAWLVLCRIF